ncbi:MAG: Gfo/Idh/MocA family oxidoreductase [Chloroflexi bacterium]|nr:Gfo/Idh/MocA family oxidoreductase [Chloroflexota bacterium]
MGAKSQQRAIESVVIVQPVRLGVVGLGTMGQGHIRSCGELGEQAELVGGYDLLPAARTAAAGQGLATFNTLDALLDQRPDALIVATPHPQHEQVTVQAAERGIHILCEKPLAASVSSADRMVTACHRYGVILGVDFQHRAVPINQTIHRLISTGTLGDLLRVSHVATDWFRTQAYYDSGNWRGTWEGEGGGVLMNQAPHDLDLYVWFAGLPQRVKASVSTRIHRIETENTVAAILEHEGGRFDSFCTSTIEFPGQAEWTFVGDRGTLVSDGKSLRLFRLQERLRDGILTLGVWGRPSGTWVDVPFETSTTHDAHTEVILRFLRAIQEGTPVLATGEDGLAALELANAAILSGFSDQPVDIPVDRSGYDKLLHSLRQREV